MTVMVLFLGSRSMKMAMRQMTQFSMVSSIWDDSLGSKHLPSAIYALAGTARGETAACSHPRRSTFTVRALHGVRSRLTRELDLSLMVVEQFVADIENFCSQITKFTYAPTTVCDCLSVWRRQPQLSVQASRASVQCALAARPVACGRRWQE